jgi:hypothetical protein
MSFFRYATWAGLLLLSTTAAGEGFVLGLGVEGDSADGRLLSGFADIGAGENTWVTLSGSLAETDGFIQDNDTVLAGIGIDHSFGSFGVRVGASYWGNADILDSRDLDTSLYLRGEAGSISVDYQKRWFEFDLQSDALRGRTATFTADGWGLSSRLALGDSASVFFGGMWYDYSRNLRIQADIDVLAFISQSRLSMINNLIDYHYSTGLEFEFGLRSLDFSIGEWQTAIDGSTIDSYSVGFLTPLADRLDAEIRYSYDESDSYGRSNALAIYFYYFGGS